MYFAYFDESGDSGMLRSPTGTFTLSALLVHDKDWVKALDEIIAFRRFLNGNFFISPRSELKASWLIHNQGDIKKAGLSYPARMAAYRAAMRFQRKTDLFRVFAIVVVKSRLTLETTDVRDKAWQYAIQRLERFGNSKNENIHVIPDEGHGDFINKKIRAMRRFNYVPSAYGKKSLERKAENIVEDTSERRSSESYFIQLADMNAYAAFRKVFPGVSFGAEIWDELGDARLAEVNAVAGGPFGIVEWPKK